jgi:hypothetical protein
MIAPSNSVLNNCRFSEEGRKRAKLCFRPVYNGLKFVCFALKQCHKKEKKYGTPASDIFCQTFEVCAWITFGMQLHIDLKWILGDSIGDAFKEL